MAAAPSQSAIRADDLMRDGVPMVSRIKNTNACLRSPALRLLRNFLNFLLSGQTHSDEPLGSELRSEGKAMGAELSDDERLIRDWLCERGYPEPEHESKIVANGQRPDFLAVADDASVTPNVLWAEVKSLQPDITAKRLSKTSPILRELGVPDGVNGDATLHVTEATREQSVRALVKRFIWKAPNYASENVRLIFIQQSSESTDIRYVEVRDHVIQKVWVRGAGDRKIAVPVGTIENPQAAATWEYNGSSQTQLAFRVFDWRMPFDCALVADIDPRDPPLTSISSMSDGSSTVAARALSAFREANAQLRNACAFKTAPGVVFIVPADDHADDLMIAIAAYGKLTALFSRNTNKFGEAFHGRDGAFRPNKYTHISAAIRPRRNGEAATYFPNPFAREPINENASLFFGLCRAAVKFE